MTNAGDGDVISTICYTRRQDETRRLDETWSRARATSCALPDKQRGDRSRVVKASHINNAFNGLVLSSRMIDVMYIYLYIYMYIKNINI